MTRALQKIFRNFFERFVPGFPALPDMKQPILSKFTDLSRTTPRLSLAGHALFLSFLALLLSASAFAGSGEPFLNTAIQSQVVGGTGHNLNQTSTTSSSLSDSSDDSGPAAHDQTRADVVYGGSSLFALATAAIDADGGGAAGNDVSATWRTQMLINSPGLENTLGTIRVTMHLNGSFSATEVPEVIGSYFSYNVGVPGAAYYGSYNPAYGWTGTLPDQLASFTYDYPFYFGVPFAIDHSLGIATEATAYVESGNGSATASVNAGLHSGGFVVLDQDNQAVNFTSQSDVGSGQGNVIPAGGPFNGFSLTNSAPGRLGSTITLLDGSASAASDVVATFIAPPTGSEVPLVSDPVDLSGTNSDPVVVQIDYSAALAQAIFGTEAALRLVWKNPATQTWVNAIEGNTGGVAQFFARAYNAATDFHVGYYGLDTAAKVAWAVVNHNSEFAVTAPLTLTTMVSEKTHGAAGIFDINLPLTGTPGVECRSSGGNHTLIFAFTNNLVSGDASVTSGTGSVSGTPTVSGNTMTVNLTGVANVQTVTVTLSSVTDVSSQVLPDTVASVSFLLGDTNGNGSVSASDIAQTKGQSGQPVTAANFREDVNANGNISASDISLVKSQAGASLP